MTNIISVENIAVNRQQLSRSDQQPNLLEYIDTTFNESFSLNLTLFSSINEQLQNFLIYQNQFVF
jgi:hypothetical protein